MLQDQNTIPPTLKVEKHSRVLYQKKKKKKRKIKSTAGYLVPCIDSPGTLGRILEAGRQKGGRQTDKRAQHV